MCTVKNGGLFVTQMVVIAWSRYRGNRYLGLKRGQYGVVELLRDEERSFPT